MNIYISGSLQDAERIQFIEDGLENAGHTVINKSTSDHKYGDNISNKIQKDISLADVIIIIASQNAFQSNSTRDEFSLIALSSETGKTQNIIVGILDDVGISNYLTEFNIVDISERLNYNIPVLLQVVENCGKNLQNEDTLNRNSVADNTSKFINNITSSLKNGHLTLVCGAGISIGAGIPSWNKLLLSLLEAMVEKLAADHKLNFSSNAAEEFNKNYRSSSLILGKYLKNNLGKDFNKNLRDTLYKNNPDTCDLIDAIVNLSRPQRDGRPLESIITFNFDGLLEENLTKAMIPNKPIYTEEISHKANEIPIYHVHGYLPRHGKIPTTNDIVFSEDAYHSQFIEPFSWSNLVQLNKLTQSTCLFIGISLTDPNMRRLLDVSWRKNTEKTLAHYMIKKVPTSDGSTIDNLARILEEQDANALGLNVIWVMSYDEIAGMLARIKN